MAAQRILFICSRNRRRSPTAERVFAVYTELEVSSAGLAPDAEEPLTPDHLEGVDIVFVMEPSHRARLTGRFRKQLGSAKVICLDIPDRYDFMDAALVDLLRARVEPHLKRPQARRRHA